ncbi:hypothetical protein [Rhodobacter capsulatus]|jgi:hypothetical protein|uniref:hypothetical protein n=1 Tax=Rhodobacter capsulatus TaxID=1061 RepID=UPI0003D36C04|nr:hypothetical protein [Rhodobacter capsulatus]ETD00536.1 hypothetical protein U714_16125 [Rhodobacter capsulatus DE442]ETD74876.1 hypothetical protein U717_16090 [Rhodobacter capsulatus R121]ETE52616.1 hypothetical protein U715_16080 [Rhodobacter capsulatus Y262]MDS0928469.1 hypothetical protein [Rhodobacter capsulatus]
MTDLPRAVARLMAQELPFEVAARELRAPASVIRQAAGADGRIVFSDAVNEAITYYKGRIAGGDAAIDAALRPTRRGPPPGLRGTPLYLRRLRRDAARAAQILVDVIDKRLARLVALSHAQAPDQPDEARRIARLAVELDQLAAALAKRNARAARGLGPKEVKA